MFHTVRELRSRLVTVPPSKVAPLSNSARDGAELCTMKWLQGWSRFGSTFLLSEYCDYVLTISLKRGGGVMMCGLKGMCNIKT